MAGHDPCLLWRSDLCLLRRSSQAFPTPLVFSSANKAAYQAEEHFILRQNLVVNVDSELPKSQRKRRSEVKLKATATRERRLKP
jgi:hypothetical protein